MIRTVFAVFALGVTVGLLAGADTISPMQMSAQCVFWSVVAWLVLSPIWMRGAK